MQTSTSTFGRRGADVATPLSTRSSRPGPAEPDSGKSNINLTWLLLSYQGRCRRLHYWMARVGLMVAYFTLLVMIRAALPSPEATPTTAGALTNLFQAIVVMLVMLAVIVGFMWATFAVDVKRCHDRNKTGWFALISLVPLLNLWTFVELGCLDGVPGDNRYGPSPKGVDAAVFI